MLKLVSNKIDTYLTSLRRHERYLFSVFRGILPYPEIMGSLLICISKMAVSSSQKFLQRFLKEIFCSGVRAFF
jgi:hypothetical protein